MKSLAFLLAIWFAILMFSGCTPFFTSQRIALTPRGELEVIEAEPDWRSILVAGVIRDETGKIVAVVPGHGVTRAEILSGVVSSAAIAGGSLGGAAIVGQALKGMKISPTTNTVIDVAPAGP